MQGTAIGSRGYTIIKNENNSIELDKIRRELTVSAACLQDYGGKPSEFRLYLESPKKLYLPKAYGLLKYGLPEIDKVPEGKDISIKFTGKLRDLQITATNAILADCKNPLKRGAILCLQCGEGKCLAKNTPVLLFNKEIIMVQDITVYHKLLGDDMKIRNILSVCTGYDDMYEIAPFDRRFMRYTVNSVHILSLIYEYYDGYYTYIDISLKEYLKLPYNAREKFYTYKVHGYSKSKFEVYPAGYGEYFGFVIDGNHRFQLGDTTITHNTISAIYMISELKKKTLIIVHKEFLLQQWCERIAEFTGDARVGILRGKTIDVKNKDIVIAMLQSLSMKDYDSDILEGFGTVVVDEVHHTGAEVFSRALKKVNFEYSIGLTATPKRADGLTKVFKWFLGDIGYTSKRRTDEVDVQIYNYYDDSSDYNEEERIYNGKLNMSKMINNICAFEPRIKFIVDIIIKILTDEPGRRIILVSDRKEHLLNLGKLLISHNYDPGYYYGGLKDWQLKAASTKNILLCTVQYVKEGYDEKGLDTLILASPKSDIIQISGRILRDKPEDRKYTPLIIDILDDFSVFVNQGKKRQIYYKKCKYNIISTKKETKVETEKYEGCCIIED